MEPMLTTEQMGEAYMQLTIHPARRSECNLCLTGGARIYNPTHTPIPPPQTSRASGTNANILTM